MSALREARDELKSQLKAAKAQAYESSSIAQVRTYEVCGRLKSSQIFKSHAVVCVRVRVSAMTVFFSFDWHPFHVLHVVL